ncbi:similar to An11g04300 [Aspergillus luchuensis]|uniref:Similar to An11g04300 n=1 Tax=Aspergillus kawachii TaxID=1069201 RepID=A0A146EY35_ASPKA|nr:similar to An11g04300 [Aspergillus luchuensis]
MLLARVLNIALSSSGYGWGTVNPLTVVGWSANMLLGMELSWLQDEQREFTRTSAS